VPRTGAAGGLSAGCLRWPGPNWFGADVVIQACGYDKILAEQSITLVITGEGKLDDQTGGGKGPMGIAQAAARMGIPVIALAGSVTASVVNLRVWVSHLHGVLYLDRVRWRSLKNGECAHRKRDSFGEHIGTSLNLGDIINL